MQSWDSQSSRGEIKDDHRKKFKSKRRQGKKEKEQRGNMVKISPNVKIITIDRTWLIQSSKRQIITLDF